MSYRCPGCGGIVRSPKRSVSLEQAIKNHDATCPGATKPRPS